MTEHIHSVEVRQKHLAYNPPSLWGLLVAKFGQTEGKDLDGGLPRVLFEICFAVDYTIYQVCLINCRP
jgi:hypothetical protein